MNLKAVLFVLASLFVLYTGIVALAEGGRKIAYFLDPRCALAARSISMSWLVALKIEGRFAGAILTDRGDLLSRTFWLKFRCCRMSFTTI